MKNFLKSNFSDFKLVIRYGISGMAAIVTNLAVFYVATNFASIFYLLSSLIAFAASIIVGFVLQKYWTFRNATSGRIHRQLVNYFLVAIAGVVLGIFFLYILTTYFGIGHFVSQAISLCIIAGLSFVANKNLTFQNQEIRA